MPLPLIIPAGLGGILATAGTGAIIAAIVRIVFALGIGVATFTVALPSFYSLIQTYFTQLPTNVFAMAGTLQVDVAITMLVSAAAAKVLFKVAAAPLISLGN